MKSVDWITFVETGVGTSSASLNRLASLVRSISSANDRVWIVRIQRWNPDLFEAYFEEIERHVGRPEVLRLVAAETPSAKKWLGYACSRWGIDFQSSVRNLAQTDGVVSFEKMLLGGRIVTEVETTRAASWGLSVAAFAPSPTTSDLTGCRFVDLKFEDDLRNGEGSEDSTVDLELAEIVVGAGMGFRSNDDLEIARSFARVQKAALGATRPLADSGLVPHDCQIGQTGKSVSPKIYWAVGISGAIHHWAGIRKSQCVVAINSDPHAPIFQYADYGIVGDYKTVLPFLEAEYGKARISDE